MFNYYKWWYEKRERILFNTPFNKRTVVVINVYYIEFEPDQVTLPLVISTCLLLFATKMNSLAILLAESSCESLA